MLSSSQQQYGTLASAGEQQAQSRSVSKYVVAFAAIALVTVGVVAFSSGSANAHVSSTVNGANSYRKTLAPVDPEVREVALKILNMTVYGLRWAVFGFNLNKDMMVPLTAGPATADWEKDFKMFANALPEADAAVAVYNFEYWVTAEETALEPIMITWAPKGMDPKEYARAGYFLGNMILELNTDEGRISTTFNGKGDSVGAQKKGHAVAPDRTGFSGPYRLDGISDTYLEFCMNEMGLSNHDCNLESGFHNCPFESEDPLEWTEANPCRKAECDGAAFTNPEADGVDAGAIPQACCDYIETEFCQDAAHALGMGCHPVTLTVIDKLCEIPAPAEPVVMFTTVEQSTACEPECVQPCTLFEDINDTWRKCEGCRTDLQPDANASEEGQVSQCYPGAMHYEMNTCCGIQLDEEGNNICQKDEYLIAEACNLMEYYNCVWLPNTDCPEEQAKQTRAAAPRGCCVEPADAEFEGTFAAPLFGSDSTFLDDIPDVDCGGGLYADEGDNSLFYAPVVDEEGNEEVQTCEIVQANMAAEVAAYEAELAAAAAAVTTTAAPARI